MTVDSFLGGTKTVLLQTKPCFSAGCTEVREDVLGAAEDSDCDAYVLRVLLRSGASSRRRAA